MKPMPLTREETERLKHAVDTAAGHINQAFVVLEPFLPLIGAEERETIPRARTKLLDALPQLIKATETDPQLAETAQFDAQAVAEDKANIDAVSPLLVPTRELAQRLSDAVLVWGGEIVVQTTAVYRVAQALQSRNPALRTLVDVLKPVFAVPKRKK